MIAYIKGRVLSKEDAALVVDVGSVGYRVAVPDAVNHAHPIGSTVELHIHYHLRENTAELYGFREQEELDLFKLLLNVSGIGPKTALNVLSVTSLDAIGTAISRGDASHLKQIAGIGAKTAERIVLELKGKIGSLAFSERPHRSGDGEIIDALVGLGYAQSSARDAVSALDSAIEGVEERLRCALQYLGKTGR